MDDLLFLSGNDIPFIEAQITIHQPQIKDIALIGEESFFTGCEMLNFSKDNLSEEDKDNLKDRTNFDILIAILKEKNAVMQKNKVCTFAILAMIFPQYEISLNNDNEESCIYLTNIENKDDIHKLDNSNYELFLKIVNRMFERQHSSSSEEYSPSGEIAKRIAKKLKDRHKKIATDHDGGNKKIDLISRYISILSVGQAKDMNMLLNYTIFQLFDEYQRYMLKQNSDVYIQAKMAGAQDLKEVEDWMKDIHS